MKQAADLSLKNSVLEFLLAYDKLSSLSLDAEWCTKSWVHQSGRVSKQGGVEAFLFDQSLVPGSLSWPSV
jgi:hypothetical protein